MADEACDAVARKLGFLPLALEHAASYVAEQGQGFGFAGYLRLYESYERDLTARVGTAEVVRDVLGRQSGEVWSHCSQTHGAGREVDSGILGSTRVRLQPFVAAQLPQLIFRQAPEEVLNRMEHRRCMRLDGNPVSRAQRVEVQGCHQADKRGRTGLVPAYLGAIRIVATEVRMVNHVGAEP